MCVCVDIDIDLKQVQQGYVSFEGDLTGHANETGWIPHISHGAAGGRQEIVCHLRAVWLNICSAYIF